MNISKQNYHSTNGEKVEKPERIFVKNNNRVTIVIVSKIQWIEAAGNYIQLIYNDKKYLFRESISGFLEKADRNIFYEIHRSTVVNIKFVDRFEQQLYGDYKVIMKSGEELKMTRSYSDFLKSF